MYTVLACKEPLSRSTTELGVGEGFCVFVFLRFVEMQYFIRGPYLGKHIIKLTPLNLGTQP